MRLNWHIKYVLLLCILASVWNSGYSHVIESLKTKEDVRKFLQAHLGKGGIIFLENCEDISQSEKNRMIYAPRPVMIDTVLVEDPITGGMVKATVEHQWTYCDTNDTYWSNYPFNEIDSIMDQYAYHLFKADIDGNGHTDIVIEAGVTIVVMDLVDKFEGHMFSAYPDSNLLSFRNFIELPDGSDALLFRTIRNSSDTMNSKSYYALDTVVYKFNGFVKYNRHAKPPSVAKVEYHFRNSSGMMCSERSTCMQIEKNGQCLLKYDRYDSVFSATLNNSSRLRQLWDQVAYLDVESKRDGYVEWIDHSVGGMFAFFFDDGTIKRVFFWGCSPPMSLRYLSKSISDISRELRWQPLQASDFNCDVEPVQSTNHTTDCSFLW